MNKRGLLNARYRDLCQCQSELASLIKVKLISTKNHYLHIADWLRMTFVLTGLILLRELSLHQQRDEPPRTFNS
jgi:hypothetical protein